MKVKLFRIFTLCFVIPLTSFGSIQANEREADVINSTPDFVLQSSQGEVKLSDYRGKVVLVYFGFINCPDACPTTLSDWTKAFNRMPELKSKVQGIMVSVDPERDSVKKLQFFTGFFHEDIIGITGAEKQLKAVVAQFGASFEVQPHEPGKNYGVAHSSETFIVAPDGKLVEILQFTDGVDKIISSVTRFARQD